MSAEALPFVHYYCACPDLAVNVDVRRGRKDAALDDTSLAHVSVKDTTQMSLQDFDGSAATTVHRLLSSQAANYLYPLSRLYFCEDCHQIRCPSCVQDEIVSYYCPNCLFEVPTASVKSEKNRCARNCFQCPICQNMLSVMASQESPQSVASAGPYFLACNVCRWNSQEIGMTFEKPTSLALQLQKNEETLPDAKEFDQLKEHFEKHLRVNSPPTLPSNFLSFSTSGAFNKIMGNQFGDQVQSDDVSSYEPSVQVPDDSMKVLETITTMRSVDPVSTLPQRFVQVHDQPYQLNKINPQRVHLCIKQSKRCRTCRHILIKPEQKAQATRFKIKLVAMNYVPNITLVKLPKKTGWPLQRGIPTQFVIKFINPLYEEMSVTLATPQIRKSANADRTSEDTATKIHGKVTILSPHFTIGAYNETIEYDDEMYPSGSSLRGRTTGPLGGTAGLASAYVDGVYEKRNNYTSIIVEVIPEKTGEFKFPLLVTYNYKSDEDRMDASSADIDEDDVDETDGNSHTADGTKKGSSIRMDDDRIKSYSFWCLIGLGHVSSDADQKRTGGQ
ncbi:dynactin p62 family-domain-containing protein [Radiomyces spectabilis]|uniref:dynactin p62 family-domain-containing protein n=1 Tax=Radiomyces spectabilis TaxID=64574 RepID=UPI0022207C6D|nr:dynactin p62 family-domain-containing protein [Radiomyces spectabilis]KAI8371396.1 dynactin p62 family-domain-containing protein [Radiomyces spectabilis]